MPNANHGQYPCFLCGDQLDIRYTKNRKPYFICDPCGLQAFIRKEKGISKFSEINKNPINTHNPNNPVFGRIIELEKLRAKLMEIEKKKDIFDFLFPNDDLEAVETALKLEITRVQKELTGKTTQK
jgi:predicted RNA-binding Zn-ribbon protein involved in translation (DUF1610 family)